MPEKEVGVPEWCRTATLGLEGWLLETRGLKFRNGVGKLGKKNRKDQLGFRKGTGKR